MSHVNEYVPIPRAIAEEAGYVLDCVELVRDASGIGWALHARTGCRWVTGWPRKEQR